MAFLSAHPWLLKTLLALGTGLGGAVWIDLSEFLKSNSWGEFFTVWKWKVASFRYVKGALGGLVSAGILHVGASLVS